MNHFKIYSPIISSVLPLLDSLVSEKYGFKSFDCVYESD